ncbi:hypothetical protein M422DRAFT_167515 [Sphaerobolus stellatus SS14]|uniref:Uncharacterized protein n=1 Tax=Sphaerobolus stellatus (strain SS14) TaxID=990650 RepID=A0A0C9VDB5_SPHS4|nr:hypothetical protein M422DRAFT_167515 [Sphaerobolus stellatus SS14]
MVNGAPERTPWQYLSLSQLRERERQLTTQLNTIKLQVLNSDRHLAYRTRVIDDHKRFIVAISTGDVKRIDALVRTALRNGLSISAILERINKAVQGLYTPKSYQEQDYHFSQLCCRLGGNTVANLAKQALSGPSLRTLRRKAVVGNLTVFSGYPTWKEIAQNIKELFQGSFEDLPIKPLGYVLMIDEIATENRLRYDPKQDLILGTCREHEHAITLSFESIEEAQLVIKALQEGKIHFASEATVIALGTLTEDNHIYPGRPIVVSGSCKKETATAHVSILHAAIKACNEASGLLQGKLYSIASDGERKRGKALTALTMQKPLDRASPIYDQLSRLKLMNFEVGENDLTQDKDYHHIFKRCRNTAIRLTGMNIFGLIITSAILERHLLVSGISQSRVWSLLQPNDKQDVPLACGLISAVFSLSFPVEGQSATYIKARTALSIVGELWMALIAPFTDSKMSLREQLKSLSQAAHMTLALYRHGKGLFMPVQLFIDIMHMVKNAYFCVAKAKIDDPEGKFFITLLGTDRLEIQFGLLRSMIGNDANADMLQVASCLTAAAESSMLLAMHPEWGKGPRCLNLPSLKKQGDMIHQKTDHLNPASWTGNVSLSTVNLRSCWILGHNQAEVILSKSEPGYTFASLIDSQCVNILRPFGETIDEGAILNEEDMGEEEEQVKLLFLFFSIPLKYIHLD